MDGPLVGSAPLLENGEGLPEFSVRFEITEQEDCVGKIADVDGSIDAIANEAVLGKRKYCRNSLLIEIGKQFMKLQHQELFPGHRIEEPIQTIDNKDRRMRLFHKFPNFIYELAGSNLRGIELKYADTTGTVEHPSP